MKQLLITIGLSIATLTPLAAQSEAQMTKLFNQATQVESFKMDLSNRLLQDLDVDFDIDHLRESVHGEVSRVRIAVYDRYREGLQAQRDFVAQMVAWGYRPAPPLPKHEEKESGQLIILRKTDGAYSPYLVFVINNYRESESILLVFSGKLKIRTS